MRVYWGIHKGSPSNTTSDSLFIEFLGQDGFVYGWRQFHGAL